MTAYTKLKLHLERNKYTRGINRGDAPADKSRRSKTHFRVVERSSSRISVLFHNTFILTATDDGEVMLDTGGWFSSPTTKDAMRTALHIAGLSGYLCTVRKGAKANEAIKINGSPLLRFEDGIRFDSNGTLLSTPGKWECEVADREERKELRARAAAFKAVFPVLYEGRAQAVAAGTAGFAAHVTRIADKIDDPDYWPAITARYYSTMHDAQAAWRKLDAALVASATMIVYEDSAAV